MADHVPTDEDVRQPGLIRRFWNKLTTALRGEGQTLPDAPPADWSSAEAEIEEEEEEVIDADYRQSVWPGGVVPLDEDYVDDDDDEPDDDEGFYNRPPGPEDEGDWTTRGEFASFDDVREYLAKIWWLEYWIVLRDGVYEIWINEETQA